MRARRPRRRPPSVPRIMLWTTTKNRAGTAAAAPQRPGPELALEARSARWTSFSSQTAIHPGIAGAF